MLGSQKEKNNHFCSDFLILKQKQTIDKKVSRRSKAFPETVDHLALAQTMKNRKLIEFPRVELHERVLRVPEWKYTGL